MDDANIKNDRNTRILRAADYETLTKAEQTKLSKAILGYGKLTLARDQSKVTVNILKRASAGMKILPENAAKIRDYLQNS